MKLKKIASLALAGIMAVSMLAGCSNNGSSSSEPETETNPVSGAAAAINGKLDDNKGKISFTEDSAAYNMLETYFANNTITLADAKTTETTVQMNTATEIALADGICKMLGVEGYYFNNSSLKNTNDKENSGVEVYLLSGKLLTEDKVMEQVAEYIDTLTFSKENSAQTMDYSYAGKVAVIKAESKGKTESAWVVAVTITQTPADK